ncbi:hypothetical protein DEAC_c44150 [Desulfosporosinus acididurans]|uniref:Uncharacterized protein n=1 Tax=Desulfosporosinus acididurans TaxID=476652 RepID=A0A0J1FJM1_9FIRM|nr:hypothetical protein [Desulfosporosinus acididurans]KLU63664.1 hypothetical protein DEAC_c44150 [Desulfosporosinus acididurans]
MIVRWESEDLTELIKKLLPAHIELETLTGKRIYFSPNLENSRGFVEAVCSILMTFFLNNKYCSLILIQEDEDSKISFKISGFLITAQTVEQEIVLSYKVLPDDFLSQYLII